MTTGLVFDIQRFSIHDGEGLRTVVFLKGCPLHCPWCANPEGMLRKPEFLYQKSRCIGCRDCLSMADGPMSEISGELIFSSREVLRDERRVLCPTGALNIKGHFYSPSEVAAVVRKDAVFYGPSGGGVTFSGGEPLLQADFLAETAQILRNEGIHCAVESCLHVQQTNLETVLPVIDEFLCDLKHSDPEIFHRYTGGDLSLVESNFLKILESKVPLRARIPVIYGFNNDDKSLKSIIRRVAEWGITRIDLLPYHSLGASKNTMLGREYNLPLTMMNPEILIPYREYAEEQGITASIGG